MAIRDRFRRSGRKSAASDEHPLPDAAGAPTTLISTGCSSLDTSPSSSTTPSTTDLSKMATVTSSSSTSSASSSSSRMMRLPWLSSPARDRREKKKTKSVDSCYGPWDKPFTETNLRHQEMFSTFTMTFGRQRRGSSGAWSYESGVSPLTSRQCSIDLSAEGNAAL